MTTDFRLNKSTSLKGFRPKQNNSHHW